METIKKEILFLAVFSMFSIMSRAQTVTDIDGNVYDTVHIGTQIWLRPNLKVTHYLNGDPIPNVTDSALWYNLTTGAYCDYNNDSANADVYGKLYNWYAINDSLGIAPLGCHVPTFEDWDTLQIYLGYDLVAGGKLKEIGTAHWMAPNTGASDEYDFTALPGGQRADSIYSGTFSEITQQGYWWSSSEMDTVYPWAVNISYNSKGFTNWAASTRKSGFSIRLMGDVSMNSYEINKGELFDIYPNPARELLVVRYQLLAGLKVCITIADITGKEIYKTYVTAPGSIRDQRIEINTGDFKAGVYLVRLQIMDFTKTKKLIIAK